jgi:hypothetical protein
MEITHFSNSFLCVKSGNTNLICDPWVGITSENAWISDPINYNGEKIIKNIQPKFIYISHLHCDHFDPALLDKINKHDISIVIKKFKIPVLKNRLIKLGFKNIVEIEAWHLKKLNKDISIAIVPQLSSDNEGIGSSIEYDLDTSIIIKSEKSKKVFYNNVDNPLIVKDYKKVKKFIDEKMNSKVNVCTFNVGAASEYPHCFLNINRNKEKNRIIKKSIDNAKKKLNILKPDIFFPSGGTYQICGKFNRLNKYRALLKPNLYKKIKYKNINTVNLLGGKTIKLNGKQKIIDKKRFNYSLTKTKINKINYFYQSNKIDQINKLDFLFSSSLYRYKDKLKKIKMKNSWKLKFFIYDDLKLNRNGKIDKSKSKVVKNYNLEHLKKKNHSELYLHLDAGLFYNLLTRKTSWNAAISGSLILYERKPNVFFPDLTASLNFLTI